MRVPFNEMKETFKKVFVKYGVPEDKAEVMAETHAESSRDGIYSHGANRVVRFINYVKKGWVDINANPTIEKEFGGVAVVNGNMGIGVTNAYFAADKAMELAKKNGIGLVGIKNTTHWMRGGTYGLYIANKGFVDISWTNTESCMPAWGGKDVKLGNNPFVMAAPTDTDPVMMDMAMSQYAYGKLQVVEQAGKQLPYPGGFDKDGNLTSDPAPIEESMRILPMGYWKGSTMAFMLDVLGAVLSDGIDAPEIDKADKGSCGGASQVFIVIDPNKITEAKRANEIIDNMKKHIKSSELDEHSKAIWYPGEDYVINRKENSEKGVFVDDGVWKDINDLLK